MTPQEQIDKMVDMVLGGNANPAEAYAKLYSLSKHLEEAIGHIKPMAIEEVTKYGKEGIERNGLVMQIKVAGGRWSYKGVAAHVSLSARLKQIELLAQTASKTGGNVTDENGEIIEPAVYLAGSDTIVCTKNKTA